MISLDSIDLEKMYKYGYTIQWIITDIAKHYILDTLSNASKYYGFKYVLGGGTGLNDIYFPENFRRFSRDIDLYLVDVKPQVLLNHLNNVLMNNGLYREYSVLGKRVVTQGFMYFRETRLNHVYKFRIELSQDIGCGYKFSTIVPVSVRRAREFTKWWMDHKDYLPRVYEVEVSVFKGLRPYAHSIENRLYSTIASISYGLKPVSVNVFSIEDIVAGKIEGVVSAFVYRGFIGGRVTGRRELKPRDIYDLAIVFSKKLCSIEKLLESIDVLELDRVVAFKALRLALLYSLCSPDVYMRLLHTAPCIRNNVEAWVNMIQTAYTNTLDAADYTPDDYIAYTIINYGEIDREYIRKKFKISDSQITRILHRLEQLGISKLS